MMPAPTLLLRRRFSVTALSGVILLLMSFAPARGDEPGQLQQAFQQAVAAVDPSIVRIETVGGFDLVGEVLTGSGPTTGCVIRSDGYIITSRFNFLANPSSVVVTLSDQQRFAAEIVANDESRMLTLLKINATGLSPLQPVPANEVRVGQWALALGRTFDLKFPNVSVGIVSALNRVWGRALQTDAKTSPVNYGGPLIDLSGRCLGIIVPLSPQAHGETAGVEWYDSGIGFAVPLTDIQAVLPRLIAGEKLKPGLMGIGFADNGPVSGDAKAIRVRPESPADRAGLLVDDVIVEVNGKPVAKLNDLKHVLGSLYAQDVVRLKVRRGEETLSKEITLTDALQAFVFPYLGVLPDRRVPADDSKGVVIRDVLPDSPAAKAMIAAGDTIELVMGEQIRTSKELAERVRRLEPEDSVPLTVLKNGATETLSAQLVRLPSEPPEALEPFVIPQSEKPVSAKVGRFNEQLPGDGLGFWIYVPENYRPDYTWGILVWLHPSGDPLEAETLRAWSQVCRERGIILVGPRAPDLSGWSAELEESIKSIVGWTQERYVIDPARITVMGRESSANFASQVAFKYRDTFRGLILQHAPLRVPPPDVDPDYPLEIAFVTSPQGLQHVLIVKTFDALKKLNFPVWIAEQEKTDGETFPPEVISRLAVWLDALDRI
ncbi:PDZ domain-containing protein [Planctomicrobium piriforme]|uniref:Serine protease Do n=1 Tax=Planctomicrobium piriforme TaxID=1576369 RepID=A0A1I3CD44_9PLAN|nr:PDZ domain-containing protein [Planctomicrobium piriforme]SFH72452.1 serine protease Do [Planctomicrobium piriforme]